MSLENGKRIAEMILQAQLIAREMPRPVYHQNGRTVEFKETPRPLSYYYRPHQYKTVSPKQTLIIYDFNVPSNHVFHIHQVANNWFIDTTSVWKIDGVDFEKVERWISSLNAPLVIKDRYLVAYQNVRWITTNNSRKSIISEVLIDGAIYLISDFKNLIGLR